MSETPPPGIADWMSRSTTRADETADDICHAFRRIGHLALAEAAEAKHQPAPPRRLAQVVDRQRGGNDAMFSQRRGYCLIIDTLW